MMSGMVIATPDQHEHLAALGGGGIPDREAGRHDIGPHRDAQPGHAEEEQREAEPERLAVALDRQRAQQRHGD